MKAIPLGAMTPIYCLGDSHTISYSNIVFGTDWSEDSFSCHTQFLRDIPSTDYASAEGGIHVLLANHLKNAGLLDEKNRPEYQTRTVSIAFLSGLPVIAPVIIMFGGEDQIQSVFMQIEGHYDFRLPGDTLYGYDATKQPIPIKAVREQVDQLLRPVLTAARVLRNAGFNRLLFHGLPPRVFDDARAALWTKKELVRAPIRAKIALLTNQIIAAFCATNDIGYVDTWAETVDAKGYLRPEFDLDGLHLTRPATMISLGKVAELLFDRTGSIPTGTRYAQVYIRAPRRVSVRDSAWDAQYESRGFAAAGVAPDDFCAALTGLDYTIRQNTLARLDWAGAPRKGRAGLSMACPSQNILDKAASLLAEDPAQAVLHAGSEVMLTISAFRPVRIDAGTVPAPASDGIHTPRGARRGFLTLTSELAITCETTEGVSLGAQAVAAGTLLVYDPARVTCRYHAAEHPQNVIELSMIPRLPNHPFRVNWAGLCDWPADPFQYTTHGMISAPNWAGAMVRERAREREAEALARVNGPS